MNHAGKVVCNSSRFKKTSSILHRLHIRKQKTANFFSTSTVMEKDFTHIIVGAGSAGCVLANRLTEDSSNNVLLVEAGPKDTIMNSMRLLWKIHMPAALTYNLCDDKYNWYYHTTPQKNVDNRVMYWPRGRVWGGSSSLNAMVYIRGHAFDYNRWQDEGAEGWDYDHCLPYFKKAQTHQLGADTYKGGDGPLNVSRGDTSGPLYQAWIEAGKQAGYPYTDDLNGFQQEGVGPMDMTVHKGRRWSAATAYLRPVLGRSNLQTEVQCFTTKIIFDGKKAVGIECMINGQRKEFRASNEVILSGGSINSPQLLMLSGIGNADDLNKLDIPVVENLPGVGENLQDHIEVYVQYKCKKPITLYSAQQLINMIPIGAEWLLKQTGMGATTHLHAGGFIRSKPGVSHPDIQYHFLPSQVIDHGRVDPEFHAFQAHAGTMRESSRGWLKLKSKNPKDHPIIEPNYLSTEEDIVDMRNCVKLTREIFQQKAFDELKGEELRPGAEVQSDSEIDAFVRKYCDSSYHPSCTCKMGAESDKMAVVNNEGQVYGLENLRVIDASIMPSVVSGNLNGPTIMIAEKIADRLRNREPLHMPNTPVYQPKSLSEQR
ncbi:choline dehydrogenase, mitochondrial-like [Styela clava]